MYVYENFFCELNSEVISQNCFFTDLIDTFNFELLTAVTEKFENLKI